MLQSFVPAGRTIHVGSIYSISPSQGYLGINDGEVKVLAILQAGIDDSEELQQAIDSYSDSIDIEDMTKYPDVAEEVEQYLHGLWVKYMYTPRYGDDFEYHIPMGIFSRHISSY
jgi:hypothetical protein